jgi:predicted DNA-binding transcriptional regulator YafY
VSHWSTLTDVFGWLSGARPSAALPRAESGSLDPAWTPPVAIRSWRRGFPFELLRYAAANRLKVEIDYRAQDGRLGPRLVEPYSLRRTRDGNLVLFVVNDRGVLRSYRVDRIAGVRPTTQTFVARFRVEL